jgi:hypothetical protein
VETTSGGKRHRINELASEVARHQQVAKSADFEFDSRRLQYHLTLFYSVTYGRMTAVLCLECAFLVGRPWDLTC